MIAPTGHTNAPQVALVLQAGQRRLELHPLPHRLVGRIVRRLGRLRFCFCFVCVCVCV